MPHDHSEVHQLNLQLYANLQESSEREFILNQSQRIAKVASWEYRIENAFLFWSDEMYNIFGLEKNFTVGANHLPDILYKDTCSQVVAATAELLTTGQPYDITIQARTPLGYSKWIRIYAFPIQDEDKIVGARGICHDITYYKEAEERLSASENKYRSLFEQALDAILIADEEGHIIEVNTSLCKMLGFDREELLTMSMTCLLPDEDRKSVQVPGGETFNAASVFEKGHMRMKDGNQIEIEATVKKFDSNRIMAIVRNVTELRRAQRQIQISEARFRSAFEFSAIGMALVSLEGNFIKVNRQLCRMLGYREDELLCRDFQSLTHPADLEKNMALQGRMIRGEVEAYKLEKRYRHKNGQIVWVNLTASIVKDEQGTRLYIVSQAEDITEEKKSKEKLIESEEQLRLFVEHNPASLAMFDRDMRYLNVSRRWITDYELSNSELIGKVHYDVFPTIPQRWKDIHERCLAGAIEKSDEDFLVREDGSIDWVRWEIHPWFRASGEVGGIIMFTEVITEQKSVKEKFSKAFDLSPDLMVIIREKDSVFVEANKKLEEIAGFKPEEVIGFSAAQKSFELWPRPEERVSFMEAYQARESVFREVHLRRKNGEIFFGSISAQRMVLGGEPHMIAVVRDITESRKNQEKLMISQANLKATINNTEIHIWSVNRNFELLTFNIPFARYMTRRYGVALVVGKGIFGDLDTPVLNDLRKKWDRHYLRALSGEIVSLEEHQHGEAFQYSLSPIIEEDKVIGVSVIAEDITERKNRDRELAEANKKIGELKLMALRSVMNPHFIFNVLSSIQFFIARNDKLNAIHYLSTFSKLIRSILSHSVSNTIKLSDEVAMLENYVQLEMTRFENKFEFQLNVDPDVDLDAIEIPSLLIQPYVENAILHGLYNKNGQGLLSIRIRETCQEVVFEIEDNGIGREASKKLKMLNSPTHRSLGSQLTEERLKLISQQSRTLLKIDDLKENGVPSGTRVTVCIPIYEQVHDKQKEPHPYG